jgi:hypothetical protein
MVTEIVTRCRSNEAPPETLAALLSRHGSDESAEPPAIAAHPAGPRVRVVAVHAATSDPDTPGTF